MLLRQRRVRPVVLLALTMLAALAVWLMLRPQPVPALVNIGPVAQFPPGSVTPLLLPATADNAPFAPIPQVMLQELPWRQRLVQEIDTRWPEWMPASLKRTPSIPMYLVNDPQQGLIVLYRRDPQSWCAVYWQDSEAHFVDPCHGAWYTSVGEYVRGPAPRGLDRFGVTVDEGGAVLVDVGQFTQGKPVQ